MLGLHFRPPSATNTRLPADIQALVDTATNVLLPGHPGGELEYGFSSARAGTLLAAFHNVTCTKVPRVPAKVHREPPSAGVRQASKLLVIDSISVIAYAGWEWRYDSAAMPRTS